MKFGLVHRIMTDALAALGVLALVASGQFDGWVSGVILVGLLLALFVREPWQRVPALRHLDTIALLAITGVQIGRIALGASLLDVLVEFAAALQIIRVGTRRGAAHDQQIIVLALLHLIAGTVLGGGLGYGLCFLGVLIVAPGALVLSHLRREVEGNYRQGARDRTGLPVDVPRILRSRRVVGKTFLAVTCLLSVPIFLFTAALFVVFPRVGLSLLLLNRQSTERMIGFSPRVDLGEVGVLRSDPTIALRVTVPDLPDPPPSRLAMHLRGTALDHYDGRAWSQSRNERKIADTQLGVVPIEARDVVVRPDGPTMNIELQPIDPPVLFLPRGADSIELLGHGQIAPNLGVAAYRGPEGEIRYFPADERGIAYKVHLDPQRGATFRHLQASEVRRYLALPPDMSPRVAELAREWTEGLTDDFDRAKAIETRLRKDYRYDLGSPSTKSRKPLEDFLFESKRGHCEFYSTAMAVLLRSIGVPTRNVNGFVGGTYNRFGRFYVVRQGDAHSWVEAFVPQRGWLTFDPTPPSDSAPRAETSGVLAGVRDFLEATSRRWDRHVVGYDLRQQIGLWSRIQTGWRTGGPSGVTPSSPRFLVGGLGAAVIVVAIVLWRRRRKVLPARASTAPKRSPSALLATELYEMLEQVMSARGVHRTAGTPPLRHAEALRAAEHPLADEYLELVRIYLEARFGGREVTADLKRDYEERVKALRVKALAKDAAA